ncbi:MAG: MATE family efflux transporter [Christensenellales bacterium]
MFKKYFGDMGFWRIALKLAFPVAMQNLLTSSFILVDTIMVGQLGDLSLSAVGMAGQFGWFLNMITFGMCSGAAVFISQYWGAKDTAGIRRTYGIAVVSVCLISALFFVIGLLFPEGVVRIFNREPDVVEAGAAYLRIACWSYLATGVNMVFCIVLRSTENVKLPMYVSLVTTVLNAFMDYGLIFGAFGMPEMGIRGAALATVISAWAGPVLILAVSAIQRNMLISPIKELFGFNKRSIAEYYEKATPVIINETLWGLGTLLFSVIFANLGYQYYAAVTIFRTFSIAFVFFIGLCNASSIMVGKNVGAGHIKRAVEDSRRFVLFVSLCSVLTGVLIIIFRFQLASVFNLSGSITPETLKLTASLLLVYGIELPVRNLPYILIVGTFRPGGDTRIGMKLDLLSLWLCSVPLTTLAAFVFKLPFIAVFAIMYAAEDYLKAILCVKYYFTYNWLRPVTDQGIKGLEEFYESRRKKPADH